MAAHALLYRTSTCWRTMVAESPDQVFRGKLLLALPCDPFDLAAAEFQQTLWTGWGIVAPAPDRDTTDP